MRKKTVFLDKNQIQKVFASIFHVQFVTNSIQLCKGTKLFICRSKKFTIKITRIKTRPKNCWYKTNEVKLWKLNRKYERRNKQQYSAVSLGVHMSTVFSQCQTNQVAASLRNIHSHLQHNTIYYERATTDTESERDTHVWLYAHPYIGTRAGKPKWKCFINTWLFWCVSRLHSHFDLFLCFGLAFFRWKYRVCVYFVHGVQRKKRSKLNRSILFCSWKELCALFFRFLLLSCSLCLE